MKDILLTLLIVSAGNSLRICTRPHYSIQSGHFYQRVELESADRCVDRCIDHFGFCKAAEFHEHKNRTLGLCVLHSIGSEHAPHVLHPHSSIDPVSTVYELLEKCPPYSQSSMPIAYEKRFQGEFERESRADAFFPEGDRLTDDDSKNYKIHHPDRYATMTSLDEPSEKVKNPFDSSEVLLSDEYKIPPEKELSVDSLTPIQPIVTHLGQRSPTAHNPCSPGTVCVPTFHSLDSGPCPARQGDPCAPKVPCLDRSCFHMDSEMVSTAAWAEWGECSVSCGMGVKHRSCPDESCVGAASMPCILPLCPQWFPWSPWSLCSSSCGQGERQRSRVCSGKDCLGASMAVESCSSLPCSSWSEWDEWSGCGQTCGTGKERRMRRCQHGLFCPGSPFEERTCDLGACPIWSAWTAWDECSASCGGGMKTRARTCSTENGCTGASEEKLPCNQERCPEWTQWTAWTICENKCDEESTRLRNRVCLFRGQPSPGCEGAAQDQMPCPTRECPTWSAWDDWSECSVTCGQGKQIRKRKCETGTNCPGSNEELRFCQVTSCPYWGEWAQWGGCSVSCGLGVCERKRKCIMDELLTIPSLDELERDFDSESAKKALIERSKKMHTKSVVRRSSDAVFESPTCDGTDVDRKTCDAGPCCTWDGWTEWSPCIGCGPKGISKRTRICGAENHLENHPTLAFQEESHLSSYARAQKGPNASASVFGLTPIIPIIHRGKRGIFRTSFQNDLQCHCPGESLETKTCEGLPCQEISRDPGRCEWTSWGEWCGCTKCRVGHETRQRFCDRSADHGKTKPDPKCRCPGSDSEQRTCKFDQSCFSSGPHDTKENNANDRYIPINSKIANVQVGSHHPSPFDRKDNVLPSSTTPFPYPVCRWSRWSVWSNCHSTNLRQRTRFCIGADELVSNCECMGLSIEKESCVQRKVDQLKENLDKELTSVDFTAEDDAELESELEAALEEESTLNSDDLGARDDFDKQQKAQKETTKLDAKEEEELNLQNAMQERQRLWEVRNEENGALLSEDSNGNNTVTQNCDWTRWSLWSDCTTTCGSGRKLRRRRCPCGYRECGTGSEMEQGECEKEPCEGERRRHPIFKIQ